MIALAAAVLLLATLGLVFARVPMRELIAACPDAPHLRELIAACPDAPHLCGPDFQVAATSWDSPAEVQLSVVVEASPSRARIEQILAELASSHSGRSIVVFVFNESMGPDRYGFEVEVDWQGSGTWPAVSIPAAEESWVATYSAIPGLAPRLFWGPAAPGITRSVPVQPH